MAYYNIEEEAWKCPKHPSKKRRTTTGVCSICLRDRLSQLCPHCANVRPCSSNCAAASSSSSSGGSEPAFCRSKSVGIPFLKSRNVSSSSRSNLPESEKSDETTAFCRSKSVGIPFLKSRNVRSSSRSNLSESEKSNKTASSSSSSGKIIRSSEPAICRSNSVGIPFLKSQNVDSSSLSNLPESEKSNKTASSSSSSGKIISVTEPAICRSKSVGIPFLKPQNVNSGDRSKTPESNKTTSFWWIFKSRKREKENEPKANNKFYCSDTRIKEFTMTVMRSRSVNVAAMTSVSGGNDVSYSPEKLKGWYLVSPMKVFRQSSSRAPKLVN